MPKTSTNRKNPVLLLIMAWLIPGSAHYLQDKKYRAGLFFLAVTLLFWIGIMLKANITFPGSAESFALFKAIGAAASGFNYLLALMFKLGTQHIVNLKEALTNEYGTTCMYTAGILNLLIMIDALDVHMGRKN